VLLELSPLLVLLPLLPPPLLLRRLLLPPSARILTLNAQTSPLTPAQLTRDTHL
jgi:hypothetical protein